MDRNTKVGDFSRPPPTAPRGHPKKKQRRDGPPGDTYLPRYDTQYSRSRSRLRTPPSQSLSVKRRYDDEDEPGSKPPHLGSYPVKHGRSPSKDFKIRGLGPPKSEPPSEETDEEAFKAPFTDFKKIFVPAVDTLFAHAEELEQVSRGAGLRPLHPNYRIIEDIRLQLDRLIDAYCPLVDEVEENENALKSFASQEDALNKSLAEGDSMAFKLKCKQADLDRSTLREEELQRDLQETNIKLVVANQQVDDCASRENGLKWELNNLKTNHSCVKKEHENCGVREAAMRRELENLSRNKKEHDNCASREIALKRDITDLKREIKDLKKEGNDSKAADYKLLGVRKQLMESISREKELKRELNDSKATNRKLSDAKNELSGEVRMFKASAAEAAELERSVKELAAKNENLEIRCLRTGAAEAKAELQRRERELKELAAKVDQLEASNRALESERMQKEAAKHYVESVAVRERDAQIDKARAENHRLQILVREREAEAKNAAADMQRLQGLFREKEAAMAALPITPLSPLLSHPFSSLGAPMGRIPLQEEHLVQPPGPYIKQEVPDETPSATGIPLQGPPAEQSRDPAQQLSQLGSGIVDLLNKAFDIYRPSGYGDAITSFVQKLGAAPEPAQISVAPTAGFWELGETWATDLTTPTELGPSLEERFAQLCLRFPFLPVQTETADQPTTTHLLIELITSLIKANHTTSPRAGLAFLQTMATLCPSATETEPSPTTTTILLATMLCELCRALEQTFPDVPQHYWDISSILGPEVHEAAEKLPIGRLAAALRHPNRSGASMESLRESLVASCGDRFCYFTQLGDSEGMGLLYCDEGNLLMMDFKERRLWLVDCALAEWDKNRVERKKLDLKVAREGGEVMFRLEAAPGEVAAFWVKYVTGDV